MARRRTVRVLGPGIRLALLLVAAVLAVRYLIGTITAESSGPAVVFAVLVLATVVALLWRATLSMRKAVRRLRA
jgi:hypothetical protein